MSGLFRIDLVTVGLRFREKYNLVPFCSGLVLSRLGSDSKWSRAYCYRGVASI